MFRALILTLSADAKVARADLVSKLAFLLGGHLLVLLGRRPPVIRLPVFLNGLWR